MDERHHLPFEFSRPFLKYTRVFRGPYVFEPARFETKLLVPRQISMVAWSSWHLMLPKEVMELSETSSSIRVLAIAS